MKAETTNKDEQVLSDDDLAEVAGGVPILTVFPSRNFHPLVPKFSEPIDPSS